MFLHLPLLKQLATEYESDKLEIISIETWGSNQDRLQRYQNKYDFDFKFLQSTDELKKDYQIQAVPVFYILDENKTIKKIIRGYGKEVTDKEIREAINELISES